MAPAISLQLYTVNAALEPDLDGGVRRLAEIGFDTVEAFAFVDRAPQLKAAFDAHGITAKTGHAFLVEETIPLPDGTVMTAPSHADTFAAAKELGLEIVIDPFVGPDAWTTREGVERVAARLNAAAVEAAEHGLRVGYHNHDHELRPQIDGQPALQVLASLLDPAVVLELDLYWASAAGIDVVAFIEELGDRIVAVHVKDGPMHEGISTASIPTDQTPAGQGDVRLAEALAAATALEYAVIEFDGFDGDVFDGVQQSYEWLTAQLAPVGSSSASEVSA
ncbi:sugar phosphate isomerase/epimerase [Curtobacterium sp. PhB115]|uniref:sugar phosphate isomerase/epimerase family protein n=1 Tax=Curtobacterium sp. PhB115 TaxID=2485173 RepID=UPI000F4BB1BC|nr:sugar phosphate isomerase/epimerase [Curtobacterium sp. PhB115]ROP61461.1 sugar phosphate isomerase/epimerase [Curtobacterium sp. PhB115]